MRQAVLITVLLGWRSPWRRQISRNIACRIVEFFSTAIDEACQTIFSNVQRDPIMEANGGIIPQDLYAEHKKFDLRYEAEVMRPVRNLGQEMYCELIDRAYRWQTGMPPSDKV